MEFIQETTGWTPFCFFILEFIDEETDWLVGILATEYGTIIDGKYEILKEIGRGGMSIVYLAMDKRLNKQWAVKEIRRTASDKNNEVIINSLLAEANLMKRLDHPALPRIVDIIESGETIYIVMDYIEGEPLDRIIRDMGPQKQEIVIEWARQLCDVLDYLHAQKPPIIYRDMKPANIILKPEGNLKVIDFGIAREYKERNLMDTTVLGTKGYAPPEQHGARQTDPRSDIYALGMTLHHLLTGADPRPYDYIYKPIRQYHSELSGGLERIIDKCTELDPDDRYQNCQELMYALEHYEEEDESYKKKQKQKLALFLFTAVFSLLMLLTGFACQGVRLYEQNRDYEQKINISEATPYDARVASYLEAIDLIGTDTRAYIKLLDTYVKNELFGDKESNEFLAKYNVNKAGFSENSEDYLNLMYKAGTTYFYLYSGGDGSFRTRMLKAYPYFQAIVDSGDTDFTYYNISESYSIIGSFYSKYVVNATSIKEPTFEAYTELLQSLQACIDSMETYDFDDAAYIRLTMYREIANLLNDHRKGFAVMGIDLQIVLELLESISQKAEQLSVTQQISLELKASLLEVCHEYADNIERSYSNIEEKE